MFGRKTKPATVFLEEGNNKIEGRTKHGMGQIGTGNVNPTEISSREGDIGPVQNGNGIGGQNTHLWMLTGP